ncbi:hypothetical protein BC828DRAFT_401688 [Blastocladiella britannica]|nr:hypothetical protein BC828DRAFT_401688 [Blastocladiella britannica]
MFRRNQNLVLRNLILANYLLSLPVQQLPWTLQPPPVLNNCREDKDKVYHPIVGHTIREVIGLDPGLMEVQHLGILDCSGRSVKDRVLTRTHYRKGCGDSDADTQRKWWLDISGTIRVIDDGTPTLKDPTTANIAARIRYIREHFKALSDFYLCPKQARLWWCNEIQRKQFQEKFVRSLAPECRTPGQRAGVIVVTGDAGRLATFRGHAPAAVSWFEDLCVRRGYTVVRMDEYRTSKLCCGCFKELDKVPLGNPWETRVCPEELHGGKWLQEFSRDVKPVAAGIFHFELNDL